MNDNTKRLLILNACLLLPITVITFSLFFIYVFVVIFLDFLFSTPSAIASTLIVILYFVIVMSFPLFLLYRYLKLIKDYSNETLLKNYNFFIISFFFLIIYSIAIPFYIITIIIQAIIFGRVYKYKKIVMLDSITPK